jgi:F0F1-type ATP synthase assembly protein I
MARPTGGAQAPSLSTVQAVAIASQFGATLAVGVALGLFAGQWLDSRLATGVVFTLIGVFLGMATAVTSTVALYRAAIRRPRADTRPPPAAAGDHDHT